MVISKPAGEWRYEDLFDLPDDGRRWEIIDGELYEMPAPNAWHAFAIGNLIALIVPAARALGGRVLTAPFDVFLRGADPVEPDILVLLPDRVGMVARRGMEGPPDVVVEVLSPSNVVHDTVRKRALYARGGVPEYWIVDTDRRTVEVLTLVGREYTRRILASGDDLVSSSVLPGLSFPAAAVFDGIPAE